MKLTTDDGAFAARLWHGGKRQTEIGPMIGDHAGSAINAAIRSFLNDYGDGNQVASAWGDERRALIPAALDRFREKNGYLPEKFSVPVVEPPTPTVENISAQTLQRIEAKLHEINIRITQAVQALTSKVISLEATVEARSRAFTLEPTSASALAGQLQVLQTSIDATGESRSKLSSQIGALTARVSVLNEGLKNAVLEQRTAHLDITRIFDKKAAKKAEKQDRKAAKKAKKTEDARLAGSHGPR